MVNNSPLYQQTEQSPLTSLTIKKITTYDVGISCPGFEQAQ